MKQLIILSFLLGLSSTAFANVEYRDISDKMEVFKFLFKKQHELVNPNCHRKTFDARASKVYVAMGCKIVRIELDKSSQSETMIQVKATYDCGGEQYPFTAHCELKL